MKAFYLLVAALFLVGSVAAAGGVAPSGVGDRIEVGVQRSPGNWLELQIMKLNELNPFNREAQLRSKGLTGIG